jgi:hypothetical protein
VQVAVKPALPPDSVATNNNSSRMSGNTTAARQD